MVWYALHQEPVEGVYLHRESKSIFKTHECPLFTLKAPNIQKLILKSLVEVHNICPLDF